MDRPSVLVVDDDRAIRSLLRVVLERAGFEVLTAEDGEQAITMLASRTFDVITLDLMMPKVDGLGVLNYLADFDPAMLPRVIIVSAAYRSVINEPVFAMIAKPFDVGDVVALALECVATSSCTHPSDALPNVQTATWH